MIRYILSLILVVPCFAASITSPLPGSTNRGTITLSTDFSGIGSVEYLLNGKQLFANGDLVTPLTNAPYSLQWSTANVWDGLAALSAIIRNEHGIVIDTATNSWFQIANGTNTTTLVSPAVGSVLSGTIDWSVTTDYQLAKGENLIWMFWLDGEQVLYTFNPNKPQKKSIDTTKLANGLHEFFAGVGIERIGGIEWFGQSQVMFEVRNVNGAVFPTVKYTVTNVADDFYHFTSDGQIVSKVATNSLWMRSMFFLTSVEFNYPGMELLPAQTKAAGINTLEGGFYSNPADSGSSGAPVDQWIAAMDQTLRETERRAVAQGWSLFLSFDDIGRLTTEMNDSISTPNSRDKIRHSVDWAIKTKRVIGFSGIDEVDYVWGDSPYPKDNRWKSRTPSIPDSAFSTLMGILKPNCPALTWFVGGVSSAETTKRWTGEPSLSDFNGIYWDIRSFRRAYQSGPSLNQMISSMDASVLGRTNAYLPNSPSILLVGVGGPAYAKRGTNTQYKAGVDRLITAPYNPKLISAQIWYAIARGMAGIRAYGYDGFYAKRSRNLPAQSDGSGEWQTLTDPDTVGVARWQAMSAAFNLVEELKEWIFQPAANAPDLGHLFTTGAKVGDKGLMLTLINGSEVSQERTLVLPDEYSDAKLYRIVGSKVSRGLFTSNLTFESGETVIVTATKKLPEPPLIEISNEYKVKVITTTNGWTIQIIK